MKKLKDEKGVSFVFALVALVVATVISVTILAAANTTVKRVSNDVKTQQTRLTLTSAAELVRDEMEKTTMTVVTDSEKKVVKNSEGKEKTYSYPRDVDDDDDTQHFDNVLSEIMDKGGASPYYTFSVQVPDKDDATKVESEVTVLAVKKANNDLVFTFEFNNETVFLNMTAQSSATESGTGTDKTTTTVTSWKAKTAVITGIKKVTG